MWSTQLHNDDDVHNVVVVWWGTNDLALQRKIFHPQSVSSSIARLIEAGKRLARRKCQRRRGGIKRLLPIDRWSGRAASFTPIAALAADHSIHWSMC